MKKALLFVCFNAILINAAQAQFSQKLVSIISDDELEATYFDYAEDQTLSRLLFRTDLPEASTSTTFSPTIRRSISSRTKPIRIAVTQIIWTNGHW